MSAPEAEAACRIAILSATPDLPLALAGSRFTVLACKVKDEACAARLSAEAALPDAIMDALFAELGPKGEGCRAATFSAELDLLVAKKRVLFAALTSATEDDRCVACFSDSSACPMAILSFATTPGWACDSQGTCAGTGTALGGVCVLATNGARGAATFSAKADLPLTAILDLAGLSAPEAEAACRIAILSATPDLPLALNDARSNILVAPSADGGDAVANLAMPDSIMVAASFAAPA